MYFLYYFCICWAVHTYIYILYMYVHALSVWAKSFCNMEYICSVGTQNIKFLKLWKILEIKHWKLVIFLVFVFANVIIKRLFWNDISSHPQRKQFQIHNSTLEIFVWSIMLNIVVFLGLKVFNSDNIYTLPFNRNAKESCFKRNNNKK